VSTTVYNAKKEIVKKGLIGRYEHNLKVQKDRTGKLLYGKEDHRVITDKIEYLDFQRNDGELDHELFVRFFEHLNLEFVDKIDFKNYDQSK
jgi:hypothetical protein